MNLGAINDGPYTRFSHFIHLEYLFFVNVYLIGFTCILHCLMLSDEENVNTYYGSITFQPPGK